MVQIDDICEDMDFDDREDLSETESETEECNDSFILHLSEEELEQLQDTIDENIHAYLDEHMILYSKENFTEKMVQEITNEIAEYLFGNGPEDEEDEEEEQDEEEGGSNRNTLKRMVEEMVHEMYPLYDIPARSEPSCITVETSVDHLTNIDMPVQRTREWYLFRHELFTASNLWKLFASECQYNSLVYEKCLPFSDTVNFSFGINNSTHWGVKYESVTTEIYKRKNGVELMELGCIPHRKYPFIGASPDGIVVSSPYKGRMLEIKNPVNRKIDGIPSEAYWIQMQIQMEVCDLDECDFVETQFFEYISDMEFWNDPSENQKGVLLRCMEMDTDFPTPVYYLFPLDSVLNLMNVYEWTNATILQHEQQNTGKMFTCVPIYWRLDVYSCVMVRRNRAWFDSALPIISHAWDTVLKERKEGYQHRAPKKKIRSLVSSLSFDVNKLENAPDPTPESDHHLDDITEM